MNDCTSAKITKRAMILYEGGLTTSEIMKVMPHLHPEEPKENVKMLAEKSIEMAKSLMVAVDHAGGSGWKTSELCKMTVVELISALALNNVKFIYTGKTKEEKKEEKKVNQIGAVICTTDIDGNKVYIDAEKLVNISMGGNPFFR